MQHVQARVSNQLRPFRLTRVFLRKPCLGVMIFRQVGQGVLEEIERHLVRLGVVSAFTGQMRIYGCSVRRSRVGRVHCVWVNVVQQVYLYPDNSSASPAYQARVAKKFPAMGQKDGWQLAPHLEFSNHAEQMTIGCLPVSINGVPVDFCRAVAQYQNMIIILYGNLTPDRWLTNEGFQNVLKAMDRRADEALPPQK